MMLQQELAKLQAARTGTLEMTAGLSQTQADFAPHQNTWSIGEILDHLLLTDQANRHQIARLIELANTGQKPFVSLSLEDFNFSPVVIPKSFLPFTELPFRMLNMFTPRALRELIFRYRVVPARAADVAQPRKGRSVRELRNELDSSITETRNLLDSNPKLNYHQLVLDHPLLGTNNVAELLRIMAAHELRHQEQIIQLLRCHEFPNLSAA
jgi:uncharacterized damage-inducible protein DinB